MTTDTHIHSLLENLQSKNLDIAIVDGSESITYNDLFNSVNQLSHKIKNHPSPRVGIVMDSSITAYVAILACWLVKKSYVPISPQYPLSRIQDIIEIGGISLLLTTPGEMAVIEIPIHSIPVTLKMDMELPSVENSNNVFLLPALTDEAYVLFTSGTTGKPKGVPIQHGNLYNFTQAFHHLNYPLSSSDRFLQMFELTFDLSIMSYLIPLTLGASFYIPNKNKIKSIAIYEVLEVHKITFALIVPSIVKTLEPYLRGEIIEHLKFTQFCGEALTVQQSQIWQKFCPKTTIDNVYGPTEATIYCSRYRLPKNQEPLNQNGIVCIGKPMFGSNFLIRNEELFIGGNQITSGYLNQIHPESFQFLNDQTYYKTGDIAKEINEQFYCLGRLDQQIKIQGFRVELSEIEYAYNSLFPSSESVAVCFHRNQQDQIILFVLTNEEFCDSHSILQKLKLKLPAYMLPSQIIGKQQWPLNQNGKIDRKLLTNEAYNT